MYDSGEEPTCQCRRLRETHSFPQLGRSLGGGDATHPIFLPGEPHEQRSLAGSGP